MALFTLATATALFDVLDGCVTLALEGAWTATLTLGEDEAPALGPARVQLAREGGAVDAFVGTVTSSVVFEGRAHVELVGGAGGLAGAAVGIHRTSSASPVALADVVADVAAGAGEQLAAGVLAGLAGRTLARWTRVAGETWGRALARVAQRHDLGWRVLADSSLWVGTETWPTIALAASLLLDDDQRTRTLLVAFDEAIYRPGTIVEGRRIVRVTYWTDGRAELEYEESDVSLLRRLVSRLSTPGPYTLTYDATVIAQNHDGTLDVRLIGGPLSDIPRVPFAAGIVGGRFIFAGGETVRVAFMGAGEDGAVAFLPAGDEAATKALARKGDSVDGSWLTIVSPEIGVYVLQVVPAGTPGAVHVTGTIDSGSSEIFVR